MEHKNKNQKGFAILEILLILVTVGFIAAISFVVVHHQKNTNSNQAPKADLSKFLQVKEWGVYFELPDTTFKDGYKVNSQDPDNITLSSSALDKLASDHPECSNANTFVRIGRSKTAPTQPDNKQIGGYYYFNSPRPSVSPCIGTNVDLMQQLSDQAYDLYDQLPTYKNVVLNP